MKILVTGATGLLGNNVVRRLVELGQPVRVLVRKTADPRPLANLPVEIEHGDVCDEPSVQRACAGVDGVVHAAGDVHIGWSRLAEQRAINVQGTQHLADAALAAGAKMVFVSSVNALAVGARDQPATEDTPIAGNVRCGYVVTKQEAEQIVRDRVARGLHAIIVNPGLMLGPWDWKPSSGKVFRSTKYFVPLAPRGGGSLCDVRDVTAAILKTLEVSPPGRQYILAGHNMLYIDFMRLIVSVAGGYAPLMRMSPGPMQRWCVGAWGDFLGWVTGREPEVNSAMMNMSFQYHYYSSQRAITELGYQIRPARETVTVAWNWLRENGFI